MVVCGRDVIADPAQNFIVSRERLRQYDRSTYLTAYSQLVLRSDCCKPIPGLPTSDEGSMATAAPHLDATCRAGRGWTRSWPDLHLLATPFELFQVRLLRPTHSLAI
jgi:hypothetical protein